jgi:hypothetical protein
MPADWQSLQLSSSRARRIHLTIRNFALPRVSTRKISSRRIEVQVREQRKKEVLDYETLGTNWDLAKGQIPGASNVTKGLGGLLGKKK